MSREKTPLDPDKPGFYGVKYGVKREGHALIKLTIYPDRRHQFWYREVILLEPEEAENWKENLDKYALELARKIQEKKKLPKANQPQLRTGFHLGFEEGEEDEEDTDDI